MAGTRIIRHGFLPAVTQRTGTYHWLPIDPDWERYVLKTETKPNSNNPTQHLLHSFMKDHSLFYGWLWRKLSPLYPEIVSRLEGGPTLPELIAMRVEALRRTDDYRWQLRDWDDSYNLDLDAVFYDEELTRAFLRRGKPDRLRSR